MPEPHGDLDALVTEVHRRVEQRALERAAMAEKRAGEVLQQADEDAARTLHRRTERARIEADELRSRTRARAEMEAKRVALRAREAALERVWEGARSALEALADDPDRYAAALRRLARLASRTLAAPEVVLTSDVRGQAQLTSDRLEAWGRQDGVRYRLDDAPATSPGLTARVGRLSCDATFATRLSEAREMRREATAERLLGRSTP